MATVFYTPSALESLPDVRQRLPVSTVSISANTTWTASNLWPTVFVTATVGSLVITLPTTGVGNGSWVAVRNAGSNAFTVGGVSLAAASTANFIWNGGIWVRMQTNCEDEDR